jgi:Flp pilus assembly protein TadB
VVFDPGLTLMVLAGGALAVGVVMLPAGFRAGDLVPGAAIGRWLRAVSRPRASAQGGRLALAVLAGGLVFVATRWPVAAVAAGALVVFWAQLFGGAAAEHLAVARLEAVVIWTESVRDTIAAGIGLEEAISTTIEQAPELISQPLLRLRGQIRARVPLDEALLDLAADLDAPGADLVIAALILSVSRRGDRLAAVLSGLADTAREELDLRRRISAGRAGLRRGVQIVVVISVLMAGYLTAFEGEFLRPYDSPAGQVALAGVLSIFAAGFAWMRHLAGVEEGEPFLARAGTRLSARDLQVIAAVTGVSPAAAADLAHAPTRPSTPSAWDTR